MVCHEIDKVFFFSVECAAEPVAHGAREVSARVPAADAVLAEDAVDGELEGNASDLASIGLELVLDASLQPPYMAKFMLSVGLAANP